MNSIGVLPPRVIELIRRADLWLLCVGMAGVGPQTGFSNLKAAGFRPIAAGATQWVILAVVSYTLARWLCG